MQQLVNTHLQEDVLIFDFTNEWEQEDIASLLALVNQQLNDKITTIETIIGGDRESHRVKWQATNMVLHFDVYSQSCWLESEIPSESQQLATMKQQLHP